MKFLKEMIAVLKNSCVYTVLITVVFCLVGLAGPMIDPVISIGQFLLICLFGIVISLAAEIFKIRRIRIVLRLLIHYVSLLLSFMIIFVATDKITTGGITGYFVSGFAFTFIYALVAVVVFLILRATHKLNAAFPAKTNNKKTEKEEYTPLYK